MKRAGMLAVGVVVTLALGACSSGSATPADTPRKVSAPTPTAFTARGTVTLADPAGVIVTNDAGGPGQDCAGTGGFDDINAGVQVVVADSDGKTLAVGRVGAGTTKATKGLNDDWRVCEFGFSVTNVPVGEKFYGITIGHRGELQETEPEMHNPAGLAFSLG